MIMKKLILVILALILFSSVAFAQDDSSDRPMQSLRGDYRQASIVAHVKITSVKFAAPDVHPLYVFESTVIESFKGQLRRGQPLVFYYRIEEDFDANRLLGESIVFLEGRFPVPTGGRGWYEIENSSLRPSKKLISQMRQIKSSNIRMRSKRSLTNHLTRTRRALLSSGNPDALIH